MYVAIFLIGVLAAVPVTLIIVFIDAIECSEKDEI